MKVECINNLCKDIPSRVYEGLYGYTYATEFVISIGQLSIVYALTTIKQNVWYLVEVEGLMYPMYFPSHLFKILDGRLSKYWIAKEAQDEYDDNAKIIKFGFKEFVEDEYFYGELLEDNPNKTIVFKKYKELMDNE